MMESTNKSETHHTSTLGGTSGGRLSPISYPKANGPNAQTDDERYAPQEGMEQEPPIPPDPPEPPDKKEKDGKENKERETKEKAEKIIGERIENKSKEQWDDFPPDVLGSQLMIPSMSDLKSPTVQRQTGAISKLFPSDCLGSEIQIPSLSDLSQTECNKIRKPLVEPEYGTYEEEDESRRIPNTGNTQPNHNAHKTNSEKRQQKRERAQAMKNLQIEQMETFNRLFSGEGEWAIYLNVKTERRMNVTKMEKHLLNVHPSEEMMVRRTYGKEDHYTIKTTCRAQSEAYLKIKRMNGQKVEITKHSELNSVWGSILIFHLEDNDEETYLDVLRKRCKNYYVEEVKLVTLKRNEKDLNILKIKFRGDKLPNTINLEGLVKEVRPYIPKPAQCYKCLKYGHYKDRCNSEEARCYKCGSSDHDPTTTNCERGEKCFNCGGNHHARSRNCKFYDYYSQVKMLQIRSGLSVREAKVVLKAKNIHDPWVKPTYSQMSRNNTGQEETKGKEPVIQQKSPERNRYEILSQITNTWGEQSEPVGKRARASPQAQRITSKKIKGRSPPRENSTKQGNQTKPTD